MSRYLILGVLLVAGPAKAYEQIDDYAPHGTYGVAHRGPDYAASKCLDPKSIPPVQRIEFRIMKGALYARSEENRAAKQSWDSLEPCKRLAVGTYTCKSKMKSLDKQFMFYQTVSYVDAQVKLNLEVLSRSGTCMVQYE